MRTTPILLLSGLMALSPFLGNAPIQARSMEASTDVSQKAKPATIKILLAKGASNSIVEVKGRYNIYNPFDGVLITSGILSKRGQVTAHDMGIKWGDIFPAVYQMRIVPGDSQTRILVNGIQYKGCIEVYSINGTINVVNEIDIENYLKSVLSLQFPKEENSELLEAVAILARTNAYYSASRNNGSYWHVNAQDINYQGYAGVLQNPHIEHAIDMTRFAVLTYKNAPFAATWTQDSAGKTAPFSTIFRKNIVAPGGVQAIPAARDREKHHWSFSVSKQELAGQLKVNRISGVEIFMDQSSNKVYALRIKDGTSSQDVDFFALQKQLGTQKLRSNDFTVSVKGEEITFSGFGEGHGVGLCLYSAKAMADHGEKMANILSTFFPQTKIEHMRTYTPLSQIADKGSAEQDKR